MARKQMEKYLNLLDIKKENFLKNSARNINLLVYREVLKYWIMRVIITQSQMKFFQKLR